MPGPEEDRRLRDLAGNAEQTLALTPVSVAAVSGILSRLQLVHDNAGLQNYSDQAKLRLLEQLMAACNRCADASNKEQCLCKRRYNKLTGPCRLHQQASAEQAAVLHLKGKALLLLEGEHSQAARELLMQAVSYQQQPAPHSRGTCGAIPKVAPPQRHAAGQAGLLSAGCLDQLGSLLLPC